MEKRAPGTVHCQAAQSSKEAMALEKKGHEIIGEDMPVNQVGGGQAIYRDPNEKVLLGASDRRKDGCAIGY